MFRVGDRVVKVTGDYRIPGQIVGKFNLFYEQAEAPAWRYVVRHVAEGGGFFCHIYSGANLAYPNEPSTREIVQAQPEAIIPEVRQPTMGFVDLARVNTPPPPPAPRLGDLCNNCGNFAMIRTGKCSTCQACGTTSGCS